MEHPHRPIVYPHGFNRNACAPLDLPGRAFVRAAATVPAGHACPHLLIDASTPSAVAARRRPAPRSFAVVLLGLILAAAVVMGLTQVDLGMAAAALAGADGQMLAIGIVLYALGQTISGVMWAVCQQAGGVRGISLPTTLGLHWIARAACEILPANLGEAVRVGLVRRHPVGVAAGGWRITGGIAGYKAIDAVVTAAAVLAIAVASPLPGPAASLRWTALVAIGAVVAAAIAWRLGAARRIARLLPVRVRGVAARLGEGAGVLRDGGAARAAAGLGIASLVARVHSLAALLAAIGAPPQAAALAFSVIVLAGIVPGAPGGAGTREVLLIPVLVLAYGMPAGTALAFSLTVQAASLGVSLVAGLVALAWLGPNLISRRRALEVLPHGALAPAVVPAGAA